LAQFERSNFRAFEAGRSAVRQLSHRAKALKAIQKAAKAEIRAREMRL
jgi:hypothetical protein